MQPGHPAWFGESIAILVSTSFLFQSFRSRHRHCAAPVPVQPSIKEGTLSLTLLPAKREIQHLFYSKPKAVRVTFGCQVIAGNNPTLAATDLGNIGSLAGRPWLRD